MLVVLALGCEGVIAIDSPSLEDPPAPPSRPNVFLDAGGPPPGQDAGAPTDAGACDVGDERPFAVYYGTNEPTLLSMSAGQRMAAVQYLTGGGLCSGTVIAPTWVLSAKHCNPSGHTRGEIRFGPNPDSPTHSVSIARAFVHPSRDLMLLELSSPVTDLEPSLTPIAHYAEAIDSHFVGRMVECAGYGRQEDGTTGERRFTAQPIVGRSGTYITVDGEGRHGLCGGDSGGPIFWQDGAGTLFVLGALTGGDSSCVGQDNYTAVDADWVRGHVGEPAPPPPPMPGPCGDVTAAGRCTDGVAEWCQSGEVRRADCGRCGLRCAPVLERGGAWCVP